MLFEGMGTANTLFALSQSKYCAIYYILKPFGSRNQGTFNFINAAVNGYLKQMKLKPVDRAAKKCNKLTK